MDGARAPSPLRGAGGLSDDQFGLEDDLLVRKLSAALRLTQQQIDGGIADQHARLADRRQRNHGGGRERDVVVADQGDVARHMQVTVHVQGLQDADGEQVVRREDGVGSVARVAFQHLLAGGPAGQHREGVGVDDFKGGERMLRNCRPRTVEPVDHLPDAARPADEREAGSADGQQVLGSEASAGHVVDGYGGKIAVVRLTINEHGRRAARTQAGEPIADVAQRRDQNPVHALFLEQVEVGGLAFQVVVGISQQDGKAFFGRAIFGTTGKVGEERVGDVEHDESQAAAASGSQLAGSVVAHEAELVDSGLHAGDGRGRDLFRPIHDVRHRPHGDLRQCCHIAHAHRCIHIFPGSITGCALAPDTHILSHPRNDYERFKNVASIYLTPVLLGHMFSGLQY